MDDSLLPKTGTKIFGVGWRRDPLGPKFQTNLVRAQRILQLSAALPPRGAPGPTRTIPIDFAHVPTPPKLRKTASPEEQKNYRLARQAAGKEHEFKFKALSDLRWRPAGPGKGLTLVVIAPLIRPPRAPYVLAAFPRLTPWAMFLSPPPEAYFPFRRNVRPAVTVSG